MSLERLLQVAGAGQIGLAVASTTFPLLLGWAGELAKLRPLLRHLFWVYAAYILTFNLSFGTLSLFRPGWLTQASPLAAAVSGFIAVYWGARLGIQLAGFDRADMPKGRHYRVAEAVLTLLFVYLTGVYATVFIGHFQG
jgi:hypothetical protein